MNGAGGGGFGEFESGNNETKPEEPANGAQNDSAMLIENQGSSEKPKEESKVQEEQPRENQGAIQGNEESRIEGGNSLNQPKGEIGDKTQMEITAQQEENVASKEEEAKGDFGEFGDDFQIDMKDLNEEFSDMKNGNEDTKKAEEGITTEEKSASAEPGQRLPSKNGSQAATGQSKEEQKETMDNFENFANFSDGINFDEIDGAKGGEQNVSPNQEAKRNNENSNTVQSIEPTGPNTSSMQEPSASGQGGGTAGAGGSGDLPFLGDISFQESSNGNQSNLLGSGDPFRMDGLPKQEDLQGNFESFDKNGPGGQVQNGMQEKSEMKVESDPNGALYKRPRLTWADLERHRTVIESMNKGKPPGAKMRYEQMKTWHYFCDKELREYQFSLVETCLFYNTLVSLPTGLGKTFVALNVINNYYRWFENGKIFFLAPTKPLVSQQLTACLEHDTFNPKELMELTGETQATERKYAYQRGRIFFMTPQTLENDIEMERLDLERIVLVIYGKSPHFWTQC